MNRPSSSTSHPSSSAQLLGQSQSQTSSSSAHYHHHQDDLERKLQGIESNLRQERESARRQKQLAAERLRLLLQEFDSMDKTIQALQNKHQAIQGEASTVLVPELQNIRINVEKLTKEVRVCVCCVSF